MITQSRLQQCLNYDPLTGIFTWKEIRRGLRTGDKAGCTRAKGYIAIRVDDKLYFAHRLAWFYVNGVWPKHCIDHINGIPDDNRIANLRDVEVRVNQENFRKARKNNLSGFLGVTTDKNRFSAKIQVNKKSIYLGSFKTPEQAHEKYLQAKRLLHEGCCI